MRAIDLTLALGLLGPLVACAGPPPRPAPIAGTEPVTNLVQRDTHAATSSYAGPAPVQPWLPLEPRPGLGNPAPEPFAGFNGRGF